MKGNETIINRTVETGKTKKYDNRLQYVDVARGLTMLCVILGHMGLDNMNILIFSFHMPLFFLISGYFQKPESHSIFCKRKIYSLLVPYAFTSICSIIAMQIKNAVKIILHRDDAFSAKHFLIECCKAALIGSGSRKDTIWIQSDVVIGNIWFLLALFFAQVIVNFLIDKKKWGSLFIGFIAIIGAVSAKFIWLPLSIQAGATAAIYVAVGYVYNKVGGGTLSDLLKKKTVIVSCSSVWILYLCLTYYFQTNLSLARAYLPFGLFDYIGSTAAVMVVLFISYQMLIKISLVNTFLAWFGKNSLIVLCFHEIEMVGLPFQDVVDFGLSIMGISSQLLSVILVFVAKTLWCCASIVIVYKIKLLSRVFNVSKKTKTI